MFVTAPLLVNNLSNGSVDVINKLVDSIASRSANDPVINLGSQTILESIFGVDNTPPNEGDPAPNILKSLAEANILVQNATTIDGQSAGQFAAQDDIAKARTKIDLMNSDRLPDDPYSDDNEEIIGSEDDDIVFGAGGDDLFTNFQEGDTFAGGDGHDAVIVDGTAGIISLWSKILQVCDTKQLKHDG